MMRRSVTATSIFAAALSIAAVSFSFAAPRIADIGPRASSWSGKPRTRRVSPSSRNHRRIPRYGSRSSDLGAQTTPGASRRRRRVRSPRILPRPALAHPARPDSGDIDATQAMHRSFLRTGIRPSGPGTPRSLGRSSGRPRPPRSVLKRFFRTVHGSSHHSRWLGSPVGGLGVVFAAGVAFGRAWMRRAELIAAQDGDWGAARRPGDVGPLGSRARRYRRRPARPGGGGARAQGRCRRRFRGGGCRAAPGRG